MPIALEADTAAETRVLECLREGAPAHLEQEREENERTVRASFLRDLAVTQAEKHDVAPLFISITNAIVDGKLELNGIGSTTAPLPPLILNDCLVDDGIDLSDSAWTSITLRGCRVGGLVARGLRVERNLVLDEVEFPSNHNSFIDLREFVAGANFEARELGRIGDAGCQLALDQASIGGSVHLTGARLACDDGDRALSMDGIIVRSDLLLDSQHRFRAKGAISIVALPGFVWVV